MKKITLLLIAIILCIPPTISVQAVDFEGNEAYYTELCKNPDELSKDEIETCRQYTDYLKEKNKNIEAQISSTQGNLNETLESIEEVKIKIAETQVLIDSVLNEISVLEANIAYTIKEIDRLEKQIADRMYFLQSYVNGNAYFFLLLKSDSIDEFLTRVQNIDELTEYDRNLLLQLGQARKQLEQDRAEADKRYNDLFALQTQQMNLLVSLGNQAANYTNSIKEYEDTISGNRVDIGYIDDSLTDAEKRIKAEEDRKKAEEEAKREEEEKKKQEEENNNNDSSNDNESNNNSSSSNNDSSSSNNTSSSTNIGNSIVATAKTKVGCNYVYGGTGPNVFDCSGFAQWVYKQNGIYIPRTVTSQYYACELVDNPQPGDLLFFNTTGYLGHVGIYVGNNLFIHAGTSSTGVCYGNLTYAYWKNCYQGAGRFR